MTAAPPIASRRSFQIAVGLVILLGALQLRLYGIDWGLPGNAYPDLSYHPDELVHLDLGRDLALGDLHRQQFMYGGTLYFSMLEGCVRIAERFGDALPGINFHADAMIVGRWAMLLAALLTIALVYDTGRRLYGLAAGALAATILALAPVHIISAQRVRPDEIGGLFVALILWLCGRRLCNRDAGSSFYLTAGLALGTAAAVRLPLLAFGLAPIVVHLAQAGAPRWKALLDLRIVYLGAAVLAAYVIASPHSVWYPQWLASGLEAQVGYQTAPFPDAAERGPGWYQYAVPVLQQALGWPLYGLAALGIVLAAARRTAADVLLFAATLPYFVSLAFASWVVVRYTVPLLPMLALLGGAALRGPLPLRSPRARAAAAFALVAAATWTLLADLAYLRQQRGADTRLAAALWLARDARPGATFVVLKAYVQDEMFAPPVPPGLHRESLYLVPHGQYASLFAAGFEYLVIHELHYRNFERLRERNPEAAAWEFQQHLERSRYRLAVQVAQPITWWGLDFTRWFQSQDYRFANPGFRIYRLEAPS